MAIPIPVKRNRFLKGILEEGRCEILDMRKENIEYRKENREKKTNSNSEFNI